MKLMGKTQSEIDQDKLISDLKSEEKILQDYLDETDWYEIRKFSRNVDIPQDIIIKRQVNIDRINQIRVMRNVGI